MNEYIQKLDAVLRHIENVRNNTEILGKKLIEQGHMELGRKLIANGLIHDNSKFHGIEWEQLNTNNPDQNKLSLAVFHHNHTNLHHPEAWDGGIKAMHDLYVYEMVSDWKARATEFGTSLIEWINNDSLKKFNYTKDDEVYKKIINCVNLLCDKPFKPLNSSL